MATADEFRLDPSRPLKTQIIILLSLQTLLFCVFPNFPSQDGPAHLGSAAVLSGLSAGDDLYQQIYASAWQFDSNQLYHALLVLLGKFMPLLAAEMVIMSLYGVAFTASLWYPTSSVHGRHEAVWLGLPVVFTGVLYMGFFNSCLVFVASILSLDLFFKLYDHCSWQRMASVASALLLTYFLHLVVLLVLLPAMHLLSIARYSTCLYYHKIQDSTSCLPLALARPLLTWGTVCCLRSRKPSFGIGNSMTAFKNSYLWVAFVAVLMLVLVMPITSGPIVILDKHLSPFLIVALITWLSTGALSSRQ